MSLGNDFLELISLLWEIEEFNMWNPKEHGTLAYLLERLSLLESYQEKYDMLFELAKAKNGNEFAMQVSLEVVEQSKSDSNFSQEDVMKLEKMLLWQKEDYNNNELSGFGIVKEKYMPDWFFELFHSYIKLEELDRETSIINYFKSEGKMTQEVAQATYQRLYTQYDILNEVYFFVKNKKLKTFYPVTAETISAKQLCETICKTPLEAYLYLVYLREEPEKALAEYEKRLVAIENEKKNNLKEASGMDENKNPVLEEETKESEVIEQAETEEVVEENATPEDVAPESEVADESAEQQSEGNKGSEDASMGAVLEMLAKLQKSFDDKIAEDEYKNKLFDNMHKELTAHQNGAFDKVINTMAMDIIQLVDSIKKNAKIYEKKEPIEENYKKLLRIVKGLGQDLEDILYRQSIEPYSVSGKEVDVKRQKIIQIIDTDDQSKDNTIAARTADGYEKDGKVLRPERIKIYKYNPDAPKED